ncbi:uncharacterized protein CC84DRAFT_1178758 [Paraphaeosphaeria sporulosa]|uniref:lytic cellulose monooxygenase (C4-dehydrogenating) n=1 Tax=Paraphaeosphaeria sporulosa TaxID=1460663 RepID=A0A177C6V2_9PLEO|nr:uncharacterized protein CC84DRAFT_1178758 [Paraphaeosphaeria sporulosa]OAG03265.1 hypothetical protein CC84DRAFT_1178758 [Paraphaeosphaeria sporulosa]
MATPTMATPTPSSTASSPNAGNTSGKPTLPLTANVLPAPLTTSNHPSNSHSPSTTSLFSPNWDYSGAAAMCGPNGTLPLFPVKTLKLAAGSVIGFGAAGQSREFGDESKDMSDFDPNFWMYHSGPATAWLSKAPDGVDLGEYMGDGDWFKIDVKPASDGLHWDYNSGAHVSIMNFTIPSATPPGKYLLRAEHLNMENGGSYKTTEMYQACAHVEITGTGTGIWLPQALWRPYQPIEELKNWQGAGPKAWRG